MRKPARGNKIRVNITIDKELLNKAKSRLEMFGGKLSTLFNSYLNDFVYSMDAKASKTHESLVKRIKELEEKVERLERKT